MSFHHAWRRLFPCWHYTHAAPRHKSQRPRQLFVENLEERSVPSILFADTPNLTVTGSSTAPVLAHANVRLIFWGTGWNSGGGPALRGQVQAAVDSIDASTYFYSPNPGADLSQYRTGISAPVRVASFTTTYNTPGATFTNDDVWHMLQHEYGMTHNFYYYVVPDPNSTPVGCGCTAEHTYWWQGSDTDANREYYGFSRNLATPSLDDLTTLYSHEMAESITDPDGGATQILPRPIPDPGGWWEISDGEAQGYKYRLNGYLVQSYWSRADGKFTVPTGQTQYFYVSRSGVLTIYGDQLTNHNDAITLDASGGGVRVTLNGEVAQFEPGAITGIEVRSGNGSDTINVLRTLSGMPVNINSTGAATVTVGNNGSLDGIQGLEMTISNPNGSTGTVIDDHSRGGTRTATFDTITTNAQYAQLTGLTTGPIYSQCTNTRDVAVYTGTGAVTVNVLATCGHGLNLHGNSPNTTVNIGRNGSLDGIQGLEMTISNANGDTGVVIDDHNRGGTRTATFDTVTTNTQYVQLTDLIPGAIYSQRANTRDVTVYTGTGVVTANVLATWGHGLNLQGNSPDTIVNLGRNGSLAGIQTLEMTITDPGGHEDVTVDDRNDGGSHTPLLSTDPADATYGQITGLALGTIYYRYADTGTLVLYTGTATATVNVQATGTTVDLGGNDPLGTTINLGNAGSVQQIRGAMSLSNDAGPLNVNFNDQNDMMDRNVMLDDFNSGREFMRLVGLAPTVIFSTTDGGGNYIVNGGSGSNVFVVASTSALITTTINGGAGNNHFVVEDPAVGTMDGVQGPLTLNGGAGGGLNYVEFYDFLSSTAHTYAFTDASLTRDGIASITFSGLSQINLFRGSGDDRVVCQLTGAGPFLNTPASTNAGGNDTLVGPDGSTNLWQLIDGSQDQLFANGNQVAVFGGFSNLKGGSGNNTFQFSDGYQLPGAIDGGTGGINTLDYTAYSTGVDVNLQTGTATGVAGGITDIQNVTGGEGDNILVGNGNHNVLTVYGGHNLVIAGGGAGVLNGGTGLNLLIGGYTDYDTNDASLQAILQFWEGVTPANYDASVNDLLAGNGVPPLNTNTVHSNGAGNQFTGGSLNLYFGSLTLDSFDTDPPNGRVIEM